MPNPASLRSSPASPRVFLITGASTGIGAATARQAAAGRATGSCSERPLEDKLAALAEELGGDERALAVACDVTEWADQQALVERALDAYGRIDVAFANAGFGGARGFDQGDVEDWKAMVLTNVYGAALTIRATMDALKESRATSCSPARSPAAARSRARSTRPPSGRSPRWARPRARTSTTPACACR